MLRVKRFPEKNLPLVYGFFWLLCNKLIKRYGSTSSGNFNNSIDDYIEIGTCHVASQLLFLSRGLVVHVSLVSDLKA